MTQLFKCPQCGYKNYVTREDLDAGKAARVDKITKRLADPDRSEPFMRSVAEGLHRFFSPQK